MRRSPGRRLAWCGAVLAFAVGLAGGAGAAQVDIKNCLDENVAFKLRDNGASSDWKVVMSGETRHFRCVGPCRFQIKKNCSSERETSCNAYSRGDLEGKYSTAGYVLVELERAKKGADNGDFKRGALVEGSACPAGK